MLLRPSAYLALPLFSIPLLSGCSGLGQGSGFKELSLTAETFSKIDTYYIDSPNYEKLRLGALSGLSKALPAGSFNVTESQNRIMIRYSTGENPDAEKIFTSPVDKGRALSDVSDAYRLARQLSPSIDPPRLERAMLKSAVVSLDPDADFLEPEENVWSVSMGGGIGVEIAIREGKIVVVRPLDDSPARTAGIRPGDRIESIDDVPVEGRSLVEVVRMLRGPRGSSVRLRIGRDSWPEIRSMTLQRAVVRNQSVSFRFLQSGIGVISIRSFDSTTARDLDQALNEAEARRSPGLILDLRQNSGGTLNGAVAVAGRFLDPGHLVVYTVGRARTESRRYLTEGGKPPTKILLAIIVDRSTQAGAEVLAATMQEEKRAIIVGSRTFGHSIIHGLFSLSDGSAIKLIVARWFTASGQSVDGKGLEPNVEVKREPVDYFAIGDIERDTYLQRAVETLGN